MAADRTNPRAETVLVTGAAGRLGRTVVNMLLSSGCSVRGLVVSKEDAASLPAGTIPFTGDLRDARMVDEACKGVDVVFHFAGIVRSAHFTVEEVMKVNVDGTRHVAEACVRNKVRHLIFASSVDVYGRRRTGDLNEEARLMPTDKYGHSKMLAEQEIMKSGAPFTITRITNIYGPGFEHSFFKVFKAITEGKMVIIGDGKNHMALINVRDVTKAFMLIKNNPKTSVDKVYNLSDGNVYTQEGLVNLAADLLKAPRPKRHVQEFLVRMLARSRNLDSDELRFLTSDRIIDISRIKKELGFVPDVTLKAGGQEIVQEFLKKFKK